MPRFQYMGCGNYVKIFKIEDNTYKATVSRDIWDSTSITKISQNMCYYIRNKKAGKNPTFKYGTIQNITSSPEVNKCDICDKIYISRWGLVRHIKKYHNEETPAINERTISTQTDDMSMFEIDEYDRIDPSEPVGYVYCFSCESMPGIYKIGMTTRNVEDRLIEANKPSTWKIPEDFKHILSKRVCNPYKKEQLIHKLLKDYRVTQRREFFKLPLVQIKCLFALLTEASMDESTE